jgi:hypothetical protein
MTVRTIECLLGYTVLYFLCWVLAMFALGSAGGIGPAELVLMFGALVAGLVVVSHLTLRSARASVLR